MNTESRPPPRIAIYGLGTYGQEFVRLAANSGCPPVAAFNRAGNKVGQDLGQLCGLDGALGVVVQDCEAACYDHLNADIAVVFVSDLLAANWPAYQRLLGAGVNLICHGTQAYYPWGTDPDTARVIDRLARDKGVTFTGTGIWDMSRIWSGILLAGPCVAINRLSHASTTEINYPRKGIIEYGGLDLTPEAFRARFGANGHSLSGMYQTIPQQVLAGLGFTITRVTEILEPITYDEPLYSLALERDIQPGHTTGIRFAAKVDTREGITANANIELRMLRPGERETMVWEIDGKPGNRLEIERRDSITASAASVLNRIPDVIAAPPGIRVISELGPMRPLSLFPNHQPGSAPHALTRPEP